MRAQWWQVKVDVPPALAKLPMLESISSLLPGELCDLLKSTVAQWADIDAHLRRRVNRAWDRLVE